MLLRPNVRRKMSSPGSLDIIIIGAGIGGLAAAIFLSKANHNVTVFESNASLSEIGAGIQISPNAMRILDYYGLKDVFDAESTENEGAELRRWDSGKVLGKHGAVMAKDIHGYSCVLLLWKDMILALTCEMVEQSLYTAPTISESCTTPRSTPE